MPRIRMIKPEFFDDPVVGELSHTARLLFIGFWTQADREGRIAYDARRLKVRLFPYDNIDIEPFTVELVRAGVLKRYKGSDGRVYVWVCNFTRHQRPHPNEAESLIEECSLEAIKLHDDSLHLISNPSESGRRNLDLKSGIRNLETETEGDRSENKLVQEPSPIRKNGVKALPPIATPPPPLNGTANSKHPVFSGQRVTVFEWMLSEYMGILGKHAEAFDLHQWFYDMDAMAVTKGIIIPKRDRGAWLQEQLVTEAQKRGLPIAFAAAATADPYTQALRESAGKGPSKRPYER